MTFFIIAETAAEPAQEWEAPDWRAEGGAEEEERGQEGQGAGEAQAEQTEERAGEGERQRRWEVSCALCWKALSLCGVFSAGDEKAPGSDKKEDGKTEAPKTEAASTEKAPEKVAAWWNSLFEDVDVKKIICFFLPIPPLPSHPGYLILSDWMLGVVLYV